MSDEGARADVARVWESVREGGLLEGQQPVVAMLSGGRDSVCLLDTAVALRGASAVHALHVNYGLREQADADERHCARLCQSLGVRLRVVRERRSAGEGGAAGGADADALAAGNLQAWARDVRYRAAGEIASESGGVIATGHTASDQVETILYRLAASPGRRALLGMSPRDRTEAGHTLVRPLLGITREHTAAYCLARGLSWREDESNESPEYARARVRLGLLPALRAVHPAAQANVLRTARLLRDEAELLDALVAQQLADGTRIEIERLAQLPPALARLVVVRLAEDAAGTYVPQAGGRVQELLALGRRGGPAQLHLGGGAGAVIERGVLRMVKLPPRAESATPRGEQPQQGGDRAD
jgi:tRNA(Ile)-lysidine synthase